jgi:hypothetical protein
MKLPANLIRLCLIGLFFILSSCKKEKIKDEQIVLYNADDFYKKIKIEDTTCDYETKRAEADIKNGKYSYNSLHYPESNSLSGKFLTDEDFKKLGITIDTTFNERGCIRMPGDDLFRINCYQNVMGKALHEKYGEIFDSINVARGKDYVASHPNEVYDMNVTDITDERVANNDNTKMKNQITFNEVEFENQFTYPKDYIPKNEKSYSYTTAEFTLLKDGTLKDLKVETAIANDANKKHKQYFENELSKYVRKAKWLSPTYFGSKVNCEMHFIFFHK